MPGDHPVHLALPTPTAVNDRSTRLHLGITVEPLLAQGGDKCGEEGSGQTCIKDGLDFDNGGIRTSPLWESGSGTSWGMPKRDVGNNLEEAVAQLCVIRLEIALNVDNENGCNYGEQTGLFPQETHQHHCQDGCGKNTHEYQRDVQVLFVFTHKVVVMLVGRVLELVIELDAGASSRSKEVWEKRWQCFGRRIFQTEKKDAVTKGRKAKAEVNGRTLFD